MANAQECTRQSIGDYRLLHLLGKGKFGTIYLAEHLHDQTVAAVKVLRVPLTGRDALHAFLNEARTVRLRHPHIVPILDFGLSDDDLPYLVMAYADEGSLRNRHLQGEKLPHQTIDTYVQQLASALQYAHDQRIVHRDVKPENMLVCSDGTVQLGDFGIARISEIASLSNEHKVVGTPAYAAPEQSQGKSCPASDQYALAIVVYEWLAGQRPFQGDPLAVMLHHHRDAPPSLRSICPEVSLQVEQVVFKALAKAPEDRFPGITDFAEALHAALQGDAIPMQSFPNLDTVSGSQDPGASVPLPAVPPPRVSSIEASLLPNDEPISAKKVPASLLSVDAPDAEPIEVLQSSWLASKLLKQPFAERHRKAIAVLLCLVLLLSGVAATLLVVKREQPAQAALPVTATAVPTDTATETPTAIPALETPASVAPLETPATVPPATPTPHATPTTVARTTPTPRATAAAVSPATATPRATPTTRPHRSGTDVYEMGVARNGVQFGFDAAHTHLNPYEQVLSTANVARITPLWSLAAGNHINYSTPAVANGMVYAGSWDHTLYTFDAKCRSACQPLWTFTTGGAITSSPAVANGLVYVGSDDGKLYAFDARCKSACQPLWSFTAGGAVTSSPTVASGIVYVGSADYKLYAFDARCKSACQPLWSFVTGGAVTSSPAVANGVVYVGSDDGKLYAFDATCNQSCQPLWSFATGGAVTSSPAVVDGIVYIGSDDGKLYAFDATCNQNCQPLWSFATGRAVTSSPAVADGIVYVGSDDGKLYAFDAKCKSACQPLWSFVTGGAVNSSPTVANGVVYVGSDDGKLYALDAKCRSACQSLWSFVTGGAIDSSPTVASGVIYVGSRDQRFYALGLAASSYG